MKYQTQLAARTGSMLYKFLQSHLHYLTDCLCCRAFIVNLGDMLERWSNGVFK